MTFEKELKLAKDLKLPYFQVYYESLVNGIHHTHNHELLHEIAQREGHNVEVDAWLRDFSISVTVDITTNKGIID